MLRHALRRSCAAATACARSAAATARRASWTVARAAAADNRAARRHFGTHALRRAAAADDKPKGDADGKTTAVATDAPDTFTIHANPNKIDTSSTANLKRAWGHVSSLFGAGAGSGSKPQASAAASDADAGATGAGAAAGGAAGAGAGTDGSASGSGGGPSEPATPDASTTPVPESAKHIIPMPDPPEQQQQRAEKKIDSDDEEDERDKQKAKALAERRAKEQSDEDNKSNWQWFRENWGYALVGAVVIYALMDENMFASRRYAAGARDFSAIIKAHLSPKPAPADAPKPSEATAARNSASGTIDAEAEPTLAEAMQRVPMLTRFRVHPRANWEKAVESIGLTYHHKDDDATRYWDETVTYRLSEQQARDIEAATNELHARVLDAVGHVIASDALLERFAIPRAVWPLLRDSWSRADPALYGRFDLMIDGTKGSAPKLLEYNADTPTLLIESARAQEQWLRDVTHNGPGAMGVSQFNALEQHLVKGWSALKEHAEQVHDEAHGAPAAGDIDDLTRPAAPPLPLTPTHHFACVSGHEEDRQNTAFMADCAQRAGWSPRQMYMDHLEWNGARFVDDQGRPVERLWKLYPHEWLWDEGAGPLLLDADSSTKLDKYQRPTQWLEPPWKAVASCKGLLVVLWDMFPNHPNLLPAYWDARPLQASGRAYVSKPMYGREGQNTHIASADGLILHKRLGGTNPLGSQFDVLDPYRTTSIYQQWCAPPRFAPDEPSATPYAGNGFTLGAKQQNGQRITPSDWTSRFSASKLDAPYAGGGAGAAASMALSGASIQHRLNMDLYKDFVMPIVGSWVVAGRSAGIILREDDELITHNESRVVPHFVLGADFKLSDGSSAAPSTSYNTHAYRGGGGGGIYPFRWFNRGNTTAGTATGGKPGAGVGAGPKPGDEKKPYNRSGGGVNNTGSGTSGGVYYRWPIGGGGGGGGGTNSSSGAAGASAGAKAAEPQSKPGSGRRVFGRTGASHGSSGRS